MNGAEDAVPGSPEEAVPGSPLLPGYGDRGAPLSVNVPVLDGTGPPEPKPLEPPCVAPELTVTDSGLVGKVYTPELACVGTVLLEPGNGVRGAPVSANVPDDVDDGPP